MSHVLIVYSTKEGHTREIAERMASVIRDAGSEVRLHSASEPHSAAATHDFDRIIVGGSVHFAQFQASLVEYVKRNRDLLTRVPSAFFSVSLSAADSSEKSATELRTSLEKFFDRTGWRPTVVRNFAGALLYTRYNFLVRFMFKRIVKNRGRSETDTSRDYDLTDWTAVETFAREFAGSAPQLRRAVGQQQGAAAR